MKLSEKSSSKLSQGLQGQQYLSNSEKLSTVQQRKEEEFQASVRLVKRLHRRKVCVYVTTLATVAIVTMLLITDCSPLARLLLSIFLCRRISARDIFESVPVRMFYERLPPGLPETVVGDFDEAFKTSLENHPLVVFGSEKSEDFWAYMYWKFIVYGVLLRNDKFSDVFDHLVYKDSIRSLMVSVLANQNYRITSSIGVHIRTFNQSPTGGGATESGAKVCHVTPWYHPMAWLYKCEPEVDDYRTLIDRYPTHMPIFIAADDLNATLVRSLQAVYGSRVYFRSQLLSDSFYSNMTMPIPWQAIPAIIDSELLSKSNVMIGNFWSSFSTVAAVRRRFQHTNLIGYSAVTWFLRLLIAFIVLIVFVVQLRRCLIRRLLLTKRLR